jgi:hypothetical protein
MQAIANHEIVKEIPTYNDIDCALPKFGLSNGKLKSIGQEIAMSVFGQRKTQLNERRFTPIPSIQLTEVKGISLWLYPKDFQRDPR